MHLNKGPGFWKFNCTALADTKYTKLIQTTIEDTIKDNQNTNPNLLIDTIKCRVRGASVKYGAHKKRTNKNNFKLWTDRITEIQQLIVNTFDNEIITTLTTELTELTSKIETLINIETAGAILRSRVQYYEEGERNSKYFYNLEKTNNKQKTITHLQTNHG